MRTLLLGLLSILCTAPLTAAAQVSFTTQDRSVTASSDSAGDLWAPPSNPFFPNFDPPDLTIEEQADDTKSAADFGLFSETASSEDSWMMLFEIDGTADATQTSSLTTDIISAQGSISLVSDSFVLDAAQLALAGFLLPGANYGWERDVEAGTSSFSVGFDVLEPRHFELDGNLALSAADAFTFSAASIELREDGGEIVASIATDQFLFCSGEICLPSSEDLVASGALAPGSYTLEATVDGSVSGRCLDINGGVTCFMATVSSSFDVSLALGAVPIPAVGPLGLMLLAAALGTAGRRELART